MDAMIDFAFGQEQCKRNQLLAYFGEHKKGTCGQCSAQSCRKATTAKTELEAREAIISTLKKALKRFGN